jgi:hypothetical protein
MKKLFLALFVFCLTLSNAQSEIKDSAIFMPMVNIAYTAQIPGGDMAKRFGFNSAIGGGLGVKTKSNWEVSLNYNYMFGNDIKETSMLDELTNSSGFIINKDGEAAEYQTFERGHFINITIGKLFPVLSPNKNSGIIFNAGVGLLVHKIKYFNLANDIVQFQGEYLKGYDRYTSGISTSQFIGYRYLSNKKLINFFVGFEFIQGYTKLQRDYQVDIEPSAPNSTRLDLLYGIKVGWILPLYRRADDRFYY